MWVAPAVAKAAIESGVAQKSGLDFELYRNQLESLQGPSKVFIRSAIQRVNAWVAENSLPKILFPEGSSSQILKALKMLREERICEPILLGYPDRIYAKMKELDLESLRDIQIIHPSQSPNFNRYAEALYHKRNRKGIQLAEARRLMGDPNYFAAMMVELDEADGVVTGASQNFADSVRPILQIIGTGRELVASGVNIVLLENKILLLADTTINFDPSAEELCAIGLQAARVIEYFGQRPAIACLSYSNFTGRSGTPSKMAKARELIKAKRPDYEVDGDIQADAAVNPDLIQRIFPFCELKNGANILLFPNLEASNIAYKLLQQLGKVEVLGPFLLGVRKSANILQRTTTVDAIVNSVVLTTLEAIYLKEKRRSRGD
jgi:malate dehydrogenase (oxaloacetate-decarboxylating)(NADP+)